MKLSKKIFTLALVALLTSIVACTGRQYSNMEDDSESNDSEVTDQTYNTDIFDTSSFGNLFDVTTSNDAFPATPTPTPGSIPAVEPVSSSQNACLASDAGLTNDGFFTDAPVSFGARKAFSTTYPSTPACFDQSVEVDLPTEYFYDQSVLNLQRMQSCFQLVVKYRPNYTDQQQVAAHFRLARMVLVRCFRNIIRAQATSLPWAQPQLNNYKQLDSAAYSLNQSFSNTYGNNYNNNGLTFFYGQQGGQQQQPQYHY